MVTTPVEPTTDPTTDPTFHRVVAERSGDLHTLASAEGTYRFASPASLTLFGWQPRDLVGGHEADFAHPDDAALLDKARQQVADHPADVVTTVYRFRCADGCYRWTEAVSRLIDEKGELLVLSTVRDIGDRRQTELELRRQATTDPLTGVANRAVFMDRLQQALRRLERRSGLVVVLFLDLDRFKLINDTIGHLMGDAVLMQMAERLQAFLRPQDTLARLGGDEFAIVVEDMSTAEEAVALATRLVEAGRTPFHLGAEHLTCTTSIGISVTPNAHRSAEGMVQEADLALYRAKGRGRDRTEMFDEDLRTRAVGRLGTERMLRRAIAEDRLRVEYQPIIELETGRTVAAEALLRVFDPDEQHLVEANTFIDVAEDAGLISRMDHWVAERVIQQAVVWHHSMPAGRWADVAINISARHLADPGLAQHVLERLSSHSLPATALRIEVTESALMEASNSAMTGLRMLRGAGVHVGLDDFGTGYSSLSYLRRFPLDFIKIDRSFIQTLDAASSSEWRIVASIIDLAHALDMAVVAEGVETTSQAEQLAQLGCDRAQGWLFAPTGPPEAIAARVMQPVTYQTKPQ